MCLRYALTVSPDELVSEFGVEKCPDHYPTGYNISPFHFLPVVCRTPEGKREVHLQFWGFIPAWAEANRRLTHVNARAETLARRPSFHNAYKRRRCIVPASGFFEWAKEEPGEQPSYIQPAASTVFGLAGLWERWSPPDGDPMETFTIVTVGANEALRPIYHRMPVVLDKADYPAWLDPDTPLRRLDRLIQNYPPERFLAYPVSHAVDRLDNDSPDVIRPLKSAVT